MSVVEQPEGPHLRLYAVDDERLWESRPRLHAEEFALHDMTHVVIDTDVGTGCWILGHHRTRRTSGAPDVPTLRS